MPGKSVFISYSHDSAEHREKVLRLAARLRQDGVNARLDQYVNGTPEQGWPRWMLDQLDEADFVLIVCTAIYYRRFRGHEVLPGRGKGVDWEGALITQELYDARSETVKFVPVMLTAGQEPFIPEPLRGHTHYELTYEERYQDLYRFLRGQAGVEPAPLGELRPVAKRAAEPLVFDQAPAPPSLVAGPKPLGEKLSARTLPWTLAATLAAAIVIGTLYILFATYIRQWQNGAVGSCLPGIVSGAYGIDSVRICPGTFIMGSAVNDPQAQADEKPAHQVTLSEFWIGKTEITNGQYRRFRKEHLGEAMLPAVNITWTEAKAACEFFGGRLPTEAEWEYAARASSQAAWSSGDDERLLQEHAWFGEGLAGTPHPVGKKKANAWGLYDMHGNVYEWVDDWYGAYSAAGQLDPAGPMTDKERVLRGGSYLAAPEHVRSANRNGLPPDYRYKDIGFRCARDSHRQP